MLELCTRVVFGTRKEDRLSLSSTDIVKDY
jgi:hypothetical protein